MPRQKNQARWNIDTEKRGGNESIDPMGKYEGESETHAQADEKARKIATPPSREEEIHGHGGIRGRETHPRRVAMSRTWRVATNDTANENANILKNRSVNPQLPFG